MRQVASDAQEVNQKLQVQANKDAVERSMEMEALRDKYEQSVFEAEEAQRQLTTLQHATSLREQMDQRVNERTSELRIRLDNKDEELAHLREKYDQAVISHEELKKEYSHVRTELALTREKYHNETSQLKSEIAETNARMEELMNKFKGVSDSHSGLEAEKSQLLDEVEAMGTVHQTLQHESDYYQTQIKELRESLNDYKNSAVAEETKQLAQEQKIRELEANLGAIRQERKDLLKELADSKLKVGELKKEIEDEQRTNFRLRSQMLDAESFQKDAIAATKLKHEVESEKSSLSRKLEEALNEITEAAAEKQSLIAKNEELLESLGMLADTVSRYDQQMVDIQGEIKSLAQERDEVQLMYQQLSSELEVREGVHRDNQQDRRKQSELLLSLRKEIDDLKRAVASKETELESKSKIVQSNTSKINELTLMRETTARELSECTTDLHISQEQVRKLQDHLDSLSKTLDKTKQEKDSLSQELAQLQQELASDNATISELKSLCRQVDSTRDQAEHALRASHQEKEQLIQALVESDGAISAKDAQLKASAADVEQLRRVVETLDAQRQELQIALQTQTDKLHQTNTALQEGKRGQEETASMVSSARMELEMCRHDINKKDAIITRLTAQLEELGSEYQNVSEEYGMKSKELQAVLEVQTNSRLTNMRGGVHTRSGTKKKNREKEKK